MTCDWAIPGPPAATTSAAGQALLAHLPEAEIARYTGGPADRAVLARLEEVRKRGWGVNAGDVTPGAHAVSAPADRLPPALQETIGRLVVAAARRLSSH